MGVLDIVYLEIIIKSEQLRPNFPLICFLEEQSFVSESECRRVRKV